MCGIAIQVSKAFAAKGLNLDLLGHRGPDSRGEWFSADHRIWLGHTRLAIIDLSQAGAQPMIDSSTGNVIIFNGEIYNHLDLRRDLSGHSIHWRGESDTETLLLAYKHWGSEMLKRVKGMFAFAIYDQHRDSLFIGRDRLGIKPLYYSHENDVLKLASETRIINHPDFKPTRKSMGAYLRYGASPAACLIDPTVRSFPPASFAWIQKDGALSFERYWTVPFKTASLTPAPASQVRKLLESSVRQHLLADVPIASFLSGGIDSSIVTALAAQHLGSRLKTFSVGFEDASFDESKVAEEVAARHNADFHRIQLAPEEVIELVKLAVARMDLPSVDAINTFIVAKKVADAGIKVALSGLGGDEIFGGYPSFRDLPRLQLAARLPQWIRNCFKNLNGWEKISDIPAWPCTAIQLAVWRRTFFSAFELTRGGLLPFDLDLVEIPGLPDSFSQISWAELGGYMRHMLLRDSDQMSMAVSLELRVPFLDHDLVEYVLMLPRKEKEISRSPKSLLIESCKDLLPESVYQRPKMGFSLPMRAWMKGPLSAFVQRGLDSLSEQNLVDPGFLRHVAAAFQHDKLHWTRLWSLVVLGHYLGRLNRQARA